MTSSLVQEDRNLNGFYTCGKCCKIIISPKYKSLNAKMITEDSLPSQISVTKVKKYRLCTRKHPCTRCLERMKKLIEMCFSEIQKLQEMKSDILTEYGEVFCDGLTRDFIPAKYCNMYDYGSKRIFRKPKRTGFDEYYIYYKIWTDEIQYTKKKWEVFRFPRKDYEIEELEEDIKELDEIIKKHSQFHGGTPNG